MESMSSTKLKAKYRISLADAIIVAFVIQSGAVPVEFPQLMSYVKLDTILSIICIRVAG